MDGQQGHPGLPKVLFQKGFGLAHNLDSMRAPQCGRLVGLKLDGRTTTATLQKTERQWSDVMCAYIRPGGLGSGWAAGDVRDWERKVAVKGF